jgi:RimJ/RimL family protein N-acetyltransferase
MVVIGTCCHDLSMEPAPFVPPDFVVPTALETPELRLEPLGPQHNEADYAAWTSSIDHIRRTPGFPDGNWPDGRSFADNLRDLRRHADDFEQRRGFTYTVLDPETADVVGCVYIYPDRDVPGGAAVQSWVRASRAELDVPLWRAVSGWLAADWPFEVVAYGEREPERPVDSST